MKTEEDIRKRRDELRDMFWDSSDDAASEILAVQARMGIGKKRIRGYAKAEGDIKQGEGTEILLDIWHTRPAQTGPGEPMTTTPATIIGYRFGRAEERWIVAITKSGNPVEAAKQKQDIEAFPEAGEIVDLLRALDFKDGAAENGMDSLIPRSGGLKQ